MRFSSKINFSRSKHDLMVGWSLSYCACAFISDVYSARASGTGGVWGQGVQGEAEGGRGWALQHSRVRLLWYSTLLTFSIYSSNLNTIKGSQAYFKTCIDKVRATHKCPLCARGYDSREGEEGLIRSVRTLFIHFLMLLFCSIDQHKTQWQDSWSFTNFWGEAS